MNWPCCQMMAGCGITQPISLLFDHTYNILIRKQNGMEWNSVKHQESLRVELAQQVQSAELLAEERNSYRAQVLEMNSALKNSLEHIKELRYVM